MKFTGTLRAPTFDRAGYIAALKQELSEAIAQAAFEWIGVVTEIIPVWSGASHGTFLPLARELGYSLSIGQAQYANNRISMGLNSATGELVADADKGDFHFTYSTTLRHLIYNEFNDANANPDPQLFSRLKDPGPYQFQLAGQKAFEKFAEKVRLPDPSKFIRSKPIRVS